MIFNTLKPFIALTCFFLFSISGCSAEDSISIKISGIPEQLVLPLPKGTNLILTAGINGGTVQSVWLAPNRDSSARIILQKVSNNEYQINLADPIVSAVLQSSQIKQFCIFAETNDKQIISSVSVQYAVQSSRHLTPTEVTIYVIEGNNRKKLNYWEHHNWYDVSKVKAFEIHFLPQEAVYSAMIEIDGRQWNFQEDERQSDILFLNMTEEIQKEWIKSGKLMIHDNFRKSGYIIRLIPDKIQFDSVPISITVIQRHSFSLPGTNDFLNIHLGDITGGQTTFSLTDQNATAIVSLRSIKQDDCIAFDYNGQNYRLTLVSLVNLFAGDDYAVFLLRPKIMTESQQIDFLYKTLSITNVKLMHNGKEYSGTAAETYLRRETGKSDKKIKSADDFISLISSFSKQSDENNQGFTIKKWDATTVEAGQWFQQIRDQEAGCGK